MKRDVGNIFRWLKDTGMRQRQIIADTGCSPASVSMTVNGKRNDRKVLEYLKEKGCPVDYLAIKG